MTLKIDHQRRDGKYPVTLIFDGGPNMFGGSYPPKIFRKLYTAEKVRETVEKHGTPEQRARYCPA